MGGNRQEGNEGRFIFAFRGGIAERFGPRVPSFFQAVGLLSLRWRPRTAFCPQAFAPYAGEFPLRDGLGQAWREPGDRHISEI